MDRYTEYLEIQGHEISPEDDNYLEELMAVASAFRTFDAALTDFISDHGYEGAPDDSEAILAFLRRRFDQAQIKPPRHMSKWFTEHRSIERSTALALCFALGLDIRESADFFRRVCLDRGFDCHDIREAICYYCLRNGRSWSDAQALIARSPAGNTSLLRDRLRLDQEVLFTGSIISQLDRFTDDEELLDYFHRNLPHFRYNHATAHRCICQIWEQIAGTEGLAARERTVLRAAAALRTSPPDTPPQSSRSAAQADAGPGHRSVADIFWQVIGLDEVDDSGKKLFILDGDRSLKPILKNNRLLHHLAESDFPDRLSIEEILSGKHKSDEKIRKTLILLVFYRFWGSMSLRGPGGIRPAQGGDADRCIDEIDRYLLECGYPALYYGNPFDWLFLFAAQDEFPLQTLRDFIHELYLYKKEHPDAGPDTASGTDKSSF